MNTAGYGYISEFKNMVSNKKSGRAFMKIPNNADLLKAIRVRDDHVYIAAISNIGRLLIFKIDELPMLAKGKGNKIINIPTAKFVAKEEFMAHAQLISLSSSLRIDRVGKGSLTLKLKDLENYISSRAKRGNMLPQGYRKVIGMAEEVESTSTEAEE
jgi:topoisomerase-4 subunit A